MDVSLGKLVEITTEEARTLEYLTVEMKAVVVRRSRGWFARYLKLHLQAHKLLKTIIARAHQT